MTIKAGLGMDIFNFIWVTILFAVIMYFIANFMIQKFNYATPGRNGNYEQAEGDVDASETSGSGKVAAASQAVNVINLLGGRANIVRCRCMYDSSSCYC